MIHNRRLWALLVIPLLLLAVSFAYGDREDVRQTLQTILVDDFDVVGDWVVKFSKYRTPVFHQEDHITPYPPVARTETDANLDADPRRSVYDEDTQPHIRYNRYTEWQVNPYNLYRWISSEQDPDYLPDGLPERANRVAQENSYHQKILGVRVSFDFPGYNWICIEPSNTRSVREVLPDNRAALSESANADQASLDVTGFQANNGEQFSETNPRPLLLGVDNRQGDLRRLLAPHYIQMMGKTRALDFWVWGANYDYDMEVHVEDFHGVTHTLPVGNLKFFGWRNLRVEIPQYIQQEQSYTPTVRGIKFIRFKVIANPAERSDNYHIYLDYMQAMTDLYKENYFGRALDDPRVWGEGNNFEPTNTNTNANGNATPPSGGGIQ